MQVQLSKETSKKINKASEALGIKEKELVNKAVRFYLDNVGQYADLRRELRAWDALSDEALLNFEKKLWKKEKSG